MKFRQTFLLFISILICPIQSWAEKQLLENEDWLFSLEKRALLEYITECALRKDQLLSITSDGVVFEFYGKVGVAPNWDGYPSSLTVNEQRWVSACVLARVNYFGMPVPINLRTKETSGFYMASSAKEQADFPYFEGGFFGNIFEIPQKKYVCQGNAAKKLLVQKKRICSFPSLDPQGKLSGCGFTIVGSCEDPMIYDRDRTIYKQVVYVWLGGEEE